METSLLSTKLNIPPIRPGTVFRPRLTDRLEESINYNLVLVSAPAGFGKTTLISEWIRLGRSKVRTAWISLDEGDNDPVRFWVYFIAALQTLQSGCGEEILPWLHSSQPPSIESILTVLINELSAVKSDCIIVLDDYHLIESIKIHDGISFLIGHLPEKVHLVIATRADPPLPLARFRGKGMMLDIHTDDLRFTCEEATSLLRELKTPGLSPKDSTALDERTEGWAVGLKMAALSLRDQKDIPGFIAAFTGSQRYIMDYLMEEVLQMQSREVRDFLMKTSVLERFNSSLCDFVTERNDSRDILLNLERDHLFIVPLDETRQWWRYEHLFANLLRHQCETVFGREQVAVFHRQASQWYEDINLPDEAVYHAKAAGDWQRAMYLIDTYREIRRKGIEYETLLGWYRSIPEELLRENLRLYTKYTELLAMTGRMEMAEVALWYIDTATQDTTALQADTAFIRGIIYRHRGDRRCIDLFEKAFTLFSPDDTVMRSRAAVNIAHVQQRYSRFLEAEKWATIACELGRRSGDISVVTMAMGQIGIINSYRARLKKAIGIYKEVSELAGQALRLGGVNDMLCMNLYYLNDLEAAAENARLVIQGYEDSGENTGMIPAFIYQVLICLACGDVSGADATMTKLDKAIRHPSIDSTWYSTYVAFRILYAIQRDNVEEATMWGERLPDADDMMLLVRHYPARLLLAQDKRKEAARLLQERYESAVHLDAIIVVIQVRIYQALAADNEEQALGFLTEALVLSEPESIIRLFVDEGRLLGPLLKKALGRGITIDFTAKLLDIISEEEQLRNAQKQSTVQPLFSLLSERELEVIRLLADDVSNRHIAEQLCVSLGTVKTHVHHIIDKLEVKDRRQAVQRAKDLELI